MGEIRPIYIKLSLIIIFLVASCSQLTSPVEPTLNLPYPLVETVSHQPTLTKTPQPIISPAIQNTPVLTITLKGPLATSSPSLTDPIPTTSYASFTPWPTGIPLGDGILYGRDFVFTQTICRNSWWYPAEDPLIILRACGEGGGHYDKGMIIVYMADDLSTITSFYPPTDTGYLEVAGAKGDRVVLRSRLGYIYIFDISEMDFVDSLIDQ